VAKLHFIHLVVRSISEPAEEVAQDSPAQNEVANQAVEQQEQWPAQAGRQMQGQNWN
jgi:hypothetical protein